MVYVVSYDLRQPGRDYKSLFEELKRSPAWWHYLESTWLISTTENANQLYSRLARYLDPNDSILIIQAGTDRYGWLPEDAWKWIQQALLR
jgi:hypothetical protein